MDYYYTIAIMDKGVKKYYADERGWIESKAEAIWFYDFQEVRNTIFDEGLDMEDVIIDKELL